MSEIRVDRSQLPRVVKTPEGYLRGDAIVTRIGVFQYLNADGTARAELRHPDDALAGESLDSLQMIPITVDHPRELVTSSNAKDLAVGQTGENVRVDGRHIVVPFTITAGDGIKAVEEGRRELSLGYRLDLIEEDGEYEGEKYTHRQKNIVYNHLALVHQARAGRAARLNLDGASVQVVETDKETEMEKVNIDGIQYDAVPEVARAFSTFQRRIDALTAEKDEAVDKAKKAEAEKEEKSGEDAINARVKQRLEILTAAQKVVNADVDLLTMSDRQIMEATIKAVHKGIVLDSKSDDYVRARFDAVSEDKRIDSPAARLSAPRDSNRSDDKSHMVDALGKSIDRLNGWRNQA